MKASIIIVSYKVPYLLLLCLESIERALKLIDAEVIVIDNASADGTQTLINSKFPKVKYIQNIDNVGFSKANNKAINLAKGEFLFLINPDTVITETAIIYAIKKHESIDSCGIVGVQLIDGTGKFLPESKINKLTLKIAILRFLGFPKSFYNYKLHKDHEGETATLVGAFMCFKKEDYKKLEGLDDNYFMYGEDLDLSYQFIKKGYKNYYFGKECIIHYKGESTVKDKIYYDRFFNSVKYYFQKHYTNSRWIVGFLSTFFFIGKWTKKRVNQNIHSDKAKSKIYCFTNNNELLHKIKNKFQKEIHLISDDIQVKTNINNALIIYDMATLTVQSIINHMKSNSANNNHFRIKPAKADVLIGSDSSTKQGEIIPI